MEKVTGSIQIVAQSLSLGTEKLNREPIALLHRDTVNLSPQKVGKQIKPSYLRNDQA